MIFHQLLLIFVVHFSICTSSLTDYCNPEVLSSRLQNLLHLDEVTGFEIVLDSECRGRINTSHPTYLKLFKEIIESRDSRILPYVHLMARNGKFCEEMLRIWANNTIPHSLLVLEALYSGRGHRFSNYQLIFDISRSFPPKSLERDFFDRWLLELRGPNVNWPFKTKSVKIRSRSGSVSHPKQDSQNVLSFFSPKQIEDFQKQSPKSQSAHPDPTIGAESTGKAALNFGHIRGWISLNGKPIVANARCHSRTSGHQVVLNKRFLGLAASKFDISDYADGFPKRRNSAAMQRLATTKKEYGFAELDSSSKSLKAHLNGGIQLIVFKQSDGGILSFKHPHNPYEDLVKTHNHVKIEMDINPSDVVLLISKTAFEAVRLAPESGSPAQENPTLQTESAINPHDIMGMMNYVELNNFATYFLNLMVFLHSRVQNQDVIAVGGFVNDETDD